MTDLDLFYSSERFRNYFRSSNRSLIIKANPPHFTVVAVSSQHLILTHKLENEVLGNDFFGIFPGNSFRPDEKLQIMHSFSTVIQTKERHVLPHFQYQIYTPEDGGVSELQYWSNINDPLLDEHGNVAYIINTSTNITDIITGRESVEKARQLEASLMREQQLNLQLNETRKSLEKLNNELEERVRARTKELSESEARLRYMLADAPVAIAMMTGPQMIVEAANKKTLEAWGKTEQVIGKPLREALPELEGQPFLSLLDEVFITGKPYYGNEVKASMEVQGVMTDVYANFVYFPLKDEQGETISIVLVANVITDLVLARKKAEQAEEMLRFAVESANVGTWHLYVETQQLIASDRLKELFGFYSEDNLVYQDLVDQIPEEHRQLIHDAINKTLEEGGSYCMEHPIIGYHDKKLRWVKATGKLNRDEWNKTEYFSGILMDITEQKRDDERKSDFIGMVSHELKTPLTSLSGFIQLFQMKAQQSNDTFTDGLLQRASYQVKKMSDMINGFLNVSRLESGKIQVNKSVFLLDELIQEMINEAVALQFSHKITFQSCRQVMVNADKDKIANVLSNLISNAIKYSPGGTSIQIACEVQNNEVAISVSDQGFGISAEDAEKLFERYYRVKRDHNISGFGIGLYLSKEIIQRHHGRIWVTSELNKGSTFTFSLPLES